MPTQPFTLRISDDIKADLQFISATTHHSQAAIASRILSEKISDQAQKIRAIQEAKAQAQAGNFISQSTMEAWVDSLGTDQELPLPTPDILANRSA